MSVMILVLFAMCIMHLVVLVWELNTYRIRLRLLVHSNTKMGVSNG